MENDTNYRDIIFKYFSGTPKNINYNKNVIETKKCVPLGRKKHVKK